MLHGGEIYDKKIEYDFSVSLNPMPCPEEVRKAIADAAKEISNYPDIYQTAFREAVCRSENVNGKAMHITPENIVGGNGASELLMAIVNMVGPEKALLPVPSFYGYEHVLKCQPECEIVRYNICDESDCGEEADKFELADRFVEAVTADVDLVILGNPNNPTGKLIRKDVLGGIMEKCNDVGATLIVDECFWGLSKAAVAIGPASDCSYVSARKFLDKYPNLFVVDAYTKLFSIPGVRVGFAMSCEQNIQKLRTYLPEWNMSVFANRAGICCADIIGKSSFARQSGELIEEEKAFLEGELKAVGIKVYLSDTNFILVKTRLELYSRLLERGILIRDCGNFAGLPKGYYRIAVKDHASNECLIQAIRDITDERRNVL